MKHKVGKRLIMGLAILVVLLVGFRIYLPALVKDYVNRTLKGIQGYTGSVEDIDLFLIAGKYTIKNLIIEKTGGEVPVPFVDIDRMHLAVDWRALFDGAIVGRIEMINPRLNFVDGKDTTDSQTGKGADWTEPITRMMPLQVNRLEIVNGEINFHNFRSDPEVQVSLDSLNAVATNLSNVTSEEDTLPSALELDAISNGGGRLHASGRMDILKVIPDMDFDMQFENADLTAFNDFLKAYAAFDAERGSLSVYSEFVLRDGRIRGYVKPVIDNLKVMEWEKDKKKPLNAIWESIVGLFAESLENQPRDQLASQVPFEGDLSNPDTEIFTAVINIFRNAFIKAFEEEVEHTVDFSQGQQGDKK